MKYGGDHSRRKHVPYRPEWVLKCLSRLRKFSMAIDRVLESLAIKMNPFALCELRGDCSIDLGVRPYAVLHYVLSGTATVNIGRGVEVDIAPGSVILAPAFLTHAFHVSGAYGETSGTLQMSGLDRVVIGHELDGQPLWAICGKLEISYRGLGGALSLLRTPIVENLSSDDRARRALDEFVYELSHPTVGTRALAESLLQQCVILLLRRRYQSNDPSLRWIDGVADESLWPALEAMLDDPSAPHSVETLAAGCALSRSVFAERFSHAFGQGPIDILRTIRMQRAADLLTRTELPVKRVAEMVGFTSRSYFSRAFSEEFNASPTEFRRSANQALSA